MSSHDRQRAQRRRFITAQNSAVTCIVANTVGDPEDELYVKFPFAEEPNRREGPVRWQPKSGPVYPTRGDDGVCIYTESGEPWLVSWEGDIGDLSGDISGLEAAMAILDGRLDIVEAWDADTRLDPLELRFGNLKLVVGATGNDFDFVASQTSDVVSVPFGSGTLGSGVGMPAGTGGPDYNVTGQPVGSNMNFVMWRPTVVTTTRSIYYLLWGTP